MFGVVTNSKLVVRKKPASKPAPCRCHESFSDCQALYLRCPSSVAQGCFVVRNDSSTLISPNAEGSHDDHKTSPLQETTSDPQESCYIMLHHVTNRQFRDSLNWTQDGHAETFSEDSSTLGRMQREKWTLGDADDTDDFVFVYRVCTQQDGTLVSQAWVQAETCFCKKLWIGVVPPFLLRISGAIGFARGASHLLPARLEDGPKCFVRSSHCLKNS